MKFASTVVDMLPLLNSSSAAAAGLLYEEPSRHFVFSAFWVSRVRNMKLSLMAADRGPDTKTTFLQDSNDVISERWRKKWYDSFCS